MLRKVLALAAEMTIVGEGDEARAFIRCPDCGAQVRLPMTMAPGEFRTRAELRLELPNANEIIRGDEFIKIMERHVDLTPDAHPNLWWSGKPCRHLRCMTVRGLMRVADWVNERRPNG